MGRRPVPRGALCRLRLARPPPRHRGSSLVPVYEHLATSGAWWDHVDALSHRIGDLHDAHPVETAALVRAWSTHDDLWLRRLAIISQPSRKDRLDTAVLTDTIEPNVTDTEFFIRKAIGWALRQHARVDPAWVRTFVAEHDGLSSRASEKPSSTSSRPSA
ncbi:DNA alkylation repair protein [Aeromicrobium sp. UC242_57]|uniref:DNA alkylation repair protein n=1 Tax=Aeromicrobium sp. UC242_57 TaxID=3374624 RepID=UPI00378A887F